VPGNGGDGAHEDTTDAFDMMGNKPVPIAIVHVIVILFAMMATRVWTEVVRTIPEALTTLCVCVVELILRDASNGTYGGQKNRDLGEEWDVGAGWN
jgi:hypothetical protein